MPAYVCVCVCVERKDATEHVTTCIEWVVIDPVLHQPNPNKTDLALMGKTSSQVLCLPKVLYSTYSIYRYIHTYLPIILYSTLLYSTHIPTLLYVLYILSCIILYYYINIVACLIAAHRDPG